MQNSSSFYIFVIMVKKLRFIFNTIFKVGYCKHNFNHFRDIGYTWQELKCKKCGVIKQIKK